MLRIIKVGYNEMAFVFANRDLRNVLQRGTHTISTMFAKVEVKTFDVTSPRLKDTDLLRFAEHPLLGKFIERRDVRDDQRLIVWQRDRAIEILPGGSYFFWKDKTDANLELISVEGPLFIHERLPQILSSGDSWSHIRKLTIKNHEKGLLYVDGEYQETLEPGPYALWSSGFKAELHRVDMRSRQISLDLVEAYSSDGIEFGVRVGLSFKALDALAYHDTFENISSELERKAQMICRTVFGKFTAPMILENAPELANNLRSSLVSQRLGAALEITDLQILDIKAKEQYKEGLASEASETLRAKGAAILNRSEIQRLKDLSELPPTATKLKLTEITTGALGKTQSLHIGSKALGEILQLISDKDKCG